MRWQKFKKGFLLIILILGLFLPIVLDLNSYYLRVAVLALIYFVLTLGYNVIVTTTGIYDLGYTAYFALGAYASALLTIHTDLSFWVILPLSIILTIIYALLSTVPILRFSGDYLSITSLALAEILRLVLNNWLAVTRGPLGLTGIKGPDFLFFKFDSVAYYYLLFFVSTISFLFIERITFSGIGLKWRAVRENIEAAESVGINTHFVKVSAYLVGALLAGLAGAIFASFQGIVSPAVSQMDNTVTILAMVILGGGNSIGILFSSFVLTIVPELMRGFSTYRLFALGLFFIFIMNLRPRGFNSEVKKRNNNSANVIIAESKENSYKNSINDNFNYIKKADNCQFPIISSGVLLQGKNITKKFGGICAVDNISFELHYGEILGLIGPNGAGKTTIMNIITGVCKASAGKIYMNGIDVTGLRNYQMAQMGIARTFQIIKLLPNLTVHDNVMIACLPNRSIKDGMRIKADFRLKNSKTEITSRTYAALKTVGLCGQELMLAKELSFGDQRRLEIARAIAAEPSIILMDEPASGLNSFEVDEIMSLIRQLKMEGKAILLIEHNMKVAMQLSDQLLVIDHGAKIAEGTPIQIQSNELVIEAYLGKENGNTTD